MLVPIIKATVNIVLSTALWPMLPGIREAHKTKQKQCTKKQATDRLRSYKKPPVV